MNLALLKLSIDAAKFVIQFLVFMTGACIFSFLNVVIYRLPEQRTLIKGHSMCKKCGHELAVKDIIPIFSWLFLGGKCRYCKEKITFRYTFVELLGGVAAVGLTQYYGYTPAAFTVFALFCLLTVISFIDNDTMIIPPQLNALVLVVGIISIWTMGGPSIVSRIIGLFCISLPLYLIILIVPDGFGGGDIKLMFAVGFFLGWKATVIAFFIGLVVGGLYGVLLLIRRKMGRKEHFAFGPFLCIGIALAVFYGEFLMNLYLGSFIR